MDKAKHDKVPPTRLPITRENVSLHSKPPAPGPKVHGSRTSSRPPLPLPRSPPPPVTLNQRRPPIHRAQPNDYVDPPRLLQMPSAAPLNVVNVNTVSSTSTITRQPESLKDSNNEDKEACTESIICPNCDKCRCRSCATPKELPRKWMCRNREISLQCAVDACTCLCCVKCVFDTLDFQDSEYDAPLSDDACACCEKPLCCQRWTCMGLLSLCLPCLCMYPLLKCGLNMCTKCYDRCTRKGCTCSAKNVPASKKFLIEHENSSST